MGGGREGMRCLQGMSREWTETEEAAEAKGKLGRKASEDCLVG